MRTRRLQRLFDIVLVLASLPVSLPLMLLVGLWVLPDRSGSIMHSQTRVGRGGRTFRMYKFRTLKAGPDDGATIAPAGDPRITRPGRLLRRWRLDELPQLFNVLRGDMSLVGPRPERPEHLHAIVPAVLQEVFSVRPGITGPAAIAFLAEDEYLASVPNPVDVYCHTILPQKLRMEQEYVAQWSPVTDLRLIAQTMASVFSKQAYRRSRAMIEQLASATDKNNAAIDTPKVRKCDSL